jgi:hypothetical protein
VITRLVPAGRRRQARRAFCVITFRVRLVPVCVQGDREGAGTSARTGFAYMNPERPRTVSIIIDLPTANDPARDPERPVGLSRLGASQVLVIDDGRDAEARRWWPGWRRRVLGSVSPRGPSCRRANHGARLARHPTLPSWTTTSFSSPIPVRYTRLSNLRSLCGERSPGVRARADSQPESLFGRYRIEVERWVKTGLGRTPLVDGYWEVEGLTACNLALSRGLGGWAVR